MKTNSLKDIITNFLVKFATKVLADEDTATIEMRMDDNFLIEYEGEQYYIPQNNSFYSEEDELLLEMLRSTFSL